MAHRIFNLYEVADYLHLSRGDIERLVRRNEIPFERKGEKLIFNRAEIDAWASVPARAASSWPSSIRRRRRPRPITWPRTTLSFPTC